ncbi:MAG: hypothetical protein ACRDUX_35660 [Mycobacterium sp.]
MESSVRQARNGILTQVAAMAAFMMVGSVASAGLVDPELSLVGGSGVPGGTVSVTLVLSEDIDDAAVSAGIDLRFPADVVEFLEPVNGNCAVADRIADTHGVAGQLLEEDVVNVEVFVLGAPNPQPPLGNGDIVTCDFHVLEGVPTGTSAVEIESPFLGDALGGEIPVRIKNGEIVITDAVPTATPTPTGEPTVTATSTGAATATPTDTPDGPTSTPTTVVVATSTATATGSIAATATATPTEPPATPTATGTAVRTSTRTPAPRNNEDDGCNIVPNGQSNMRGTLALLLAPAMLLWARRRRF